jgi:hypothetical protein
MKYLHLRTLRIMGACPSAIEDFIHLYGERMPVTKQQLRRWQLWNQARCSRLDTRGYTTAPPLTIQRAVPPLWVEDFLWLLSPIECACGRRQAKRVWTININCLIDRLYLALMEYLALMDICHE